MQDIYLSVSAEHAKDAADISKLIEANKYDDAVIGTADLCAKTGIDLQPWWGTKLAIVQSTY